MAKTISSKIIKNICNVDETDSSSIFFGEISWNGRECKGYDIRRIDKATNMPYKGITVSYEGFKDIVLHAIEEGCCSEDEIQRALKSKKNKIFSNEDFEDMFSKVSIEHEKYKRDCYGVLRDAEGRRVIMGRRK